MGGAWSRRLQAAIDHFDDMSRRSRPDRSERSEAARSPLSALCLLLSAFRPPSSVLCPPSSIIPVFFRDIVPARGHLPGVLPGAGCLFCKNQLPPKSSLLPPIFIMKKTSKRIGAPQESCLFLFFSKNKQLAEATISNHQQRPLNFK
jgi:hypothetical protein